VTGGSPGKRLSRLFRSILIWGRMVEMGTATMVSRMAIQLSAIFAVIGIGLLYLAIAISDASETTKIIWASGLSLTVATVFLIIWTMARDSARLQERETKRRPVQ